MTTGGDKSAGFTIVETLIVLGVSALIAASAMLLVNGRQNRTQFQVAANSLKQRIEQVINETRNGYYQGNGDFTCNGTATPPTISAGAKAQGTNNTCIFLGKAMEFGVNVSAPDPEYFATYPLIGKRQVNVAGTQQEVSSFALARPIALAPGTSPIPVNYSEFSKTQNGLTFKKAIYHLNSGDVTVNDYAVFAFADNLSGYAPNPMGDLDSSTEKLSLYYFNNSPNWGALAPNNSANIVDVINSKNINEVAGQELKTLDLCFASGSTDKSVTYSITGLGQLSVRLKVSNLAC